ncbi:MAG: DUF1761 domain-containing protein [Flavobacteriales bacterium]
MEINHLATIAAALSDFLVGGLWYSPILFFKPWKEANGLTDEKLKESKPAITFSVVGIMSLVISYNLAFFLSEEGTDAAWGATAGFLAGMWAASAFVIIGMFELRSLKYHLVNIGYLLVAFTLKGFIIGIWR